MEDKEDYIDSLNSDKVIEFLDNKKNWKEQIVRKEKDAFNAIENNMPVEHRPLIISPNQRNQFRYIHIQTLEEIVNLEEDVAAIEEREEKELKDLDLNIINSKICIIPSYSYKQKSEDGSSGGGSIMKCLFCENKMYFAVSWINSTRPEDVRFYDYLAIANKKYENIKNREYLRKFILSHLKINGNNTNSTPTAAATESEDPNDDTIKTYIFGICTEHLAVHIKEVIKDVDIDVRAGNKSISFDTVDKMIYNCDRDDLVAAMYHSVEGSEGSPLRPE
jgi:hypothetical protein